MMFSLDVYKRLKEEINRLLTKEEDLMDEDESMIDLISSSNNSKGVLRLAKELKEEGNILFKQRKIDDALEKYGYARIVLARYEFVEELDMIECFQLAICVMLNSATCFGKKNEFEQVGGICSLILDFDPNNVKALFRRAMATIELGKKDWAYWDLFMAAKVEPGNREVTVKLEEIKSSLYKDISKKHSPDDKPEGLGLGLSFPRKKAKDNWEEDNRTEQEDMQGMESTSSLNDKKEPHGQSAAKDTGSQECSNLKGDKSLTEQMKELKEEKMGDEESEARSSAIGIHHHKATNKIEVGTSSSLAPSLRGKRQSRLSLPARRMKTLKNGVGKKSFCSFSNFSSECRLNVGRKRKDLITSSSCFCNPPRKRLFCSTSVNSINVYFDVDLLCQACCATSNVTHKMAISQE